MSAKHDVDRVEDILRMEVENVFVCVEGIDIAVKIDSLMSISAANLINLIREKRLFYTKKVGG